MNSMATSPLFSKTLNWNIKILAVLITIINAVNPGRKYSINDGEFFILQTNGCQDFTLAMIFTKASL